MQLQIAVGGYFNHFLGLYYMPHIINIYKKLEVNIGETT
jgi:hypothetical protein